MLVTLDEIFPLLDVMLYSGKEIELTVTGTSMMPLLKNRVDSVVLTKIKAPLKKGDIILYKRKNGKYILHRILKILDGEYFLIGDNQTDIEKGIFEENIIAVVISFNRKGKSHRVNERLYKLYHFIWLRIIPLRPYINRIIWRLR